MVFAFNDLAVEPESALVLRRYLNVTRTALRRRATPSDDGEGALARAVLQTLVARGERLADDLVACSGRQLWQAADVELSPLLASLAALLRGTLDQRIAISVDVADDCPPCRTDPRALERALQHLAVNARDAMPDGGGLRLLARSGRLGDGAPSVDVSVADTGMGMTEQVAERALEPFFTTRTNDPLAGVGLAAVAGFARQSGGSVSLDTSPGTGTWVTLHLPQVMPYGHR